MNDKALAPRENPNVLTVQGIMSDFDSYLKFADCMQVADASGSNPKVTLAKMVWGAEHGIGPIASIQGLHVIKNRMGMSSQLMAAIVDRDGWELSYNDSQTPGMWCEVTASKQGRKDISFKWTIEMARKAGLQGENWKKYPHAMLRSRCVAEVARRASPGRLMGMYTPDEIEYSVEIAEPDESVVDALVTQESLPEQVETSTPVDAESDMDKSERELIVNEIISYGERQEIIMEFDKRPQRMDYVKELVDHFGGGSDGARAALKHAQSDAPWPTRANPPQAEDASQEDGAEQRTAPAVEGAPS